MPAFVHRDVLAAMNDAHLAVAARDARELMPLPEARALVAGLQVFTKDASETTSVLGADTAWAALLSLADADEFLAAALRIRWNFHVRGRENLAAFARFGDAILPWIAAAVNARGVLRNVPWCLRPCLMAMGSAEALTVALGIRGIDEGLADPDADPDADQDVGDPAAPSPTELGLGPAWLAAALAERLPVVLTLATRAAAAGAAGDPRFAALLGATVARLGVAALELLAPHATPSADSGPEAAVAAALDALGIPVPTADPELAAALADLPRAATPRGPAWSVVDLDQDDMFPYWNVLDGYETPYAIRVSAFADGAGDVLFVQRFARDQRASMPGFVQIAAYGPGATRFDRARAFRPLIDEEDVAGLHLQLGDSYQGYVEGLTEVVRVTGDADEHGVRLPDAWDNRYVRNPMPLAAALVRLGGEDVSVPPQLPAAWAAVALDAAEGDAVLADQWLRSIDPGEGLLLRLAATHRERVFVPATELRTLAGLAEAELLFELDDPALPQVFMDEPPSKTAPWPLICEALRQRVRLDPARIPQVDVLHRRLLWTDNRDGAPDHWGPELPPTAAIGGGGGDDSDDPAAYPRELLARGWPHGIRLLHQHPHNDLANVPAIFDWVIAQPTLPLRSNWAREIGLRFVRHAGGDPAARDHAGWLYPAEARVLLGTIFGRGAEVLGPPAAEAAVLLLEAFIGAPAVLNLAADILTAVPEAARSAPHPDAFHAVFALGWVLGRAVSPESSAARARLAELAPGFPIGADLGRALDLILHQAEGAKRSARTPAEWLFSGDANGLAARVAADAQPLPLDVQLAVLLGDVALARWAQQPIADADKAWFADDLALLGPSAAALVHALRT